MTLAATEYKFNEGNARKLITTLLTSYATLYDVMDSNKDVIRENHALIASKTRRNIMKALRHPWCEEEKWLEILSQVNSGEPPVPLMRETVPTLFWSYASISLKCSADPEKPYPTRRCSQLYTYNQELSSDKVEDTAVVDVFDNSMYMSSEPDLYDVEYISECELLPPSIPKYELSEMRTPAPVSLFWTSEDVTLQDNAIVDSHSEDAITSDSAAIIELNQDSINASTGADKHDPARISSANQELSSTTCAELEECNISDTCSTDKQTSESHHISCGGSGDVIGQALCKSEQVTGRHTGLGYDSVLFPIAEEVEEEEGEKETQDSNNSSWTDEATIRSDIAATLDWSDDDIWDSMDIESLNPECASAVDVGELQTNSVEVSNTDVLNESNASIALKAPNVIIGAVTRPWCIEHNWLELLSQAKPDTSQTDIAIPSDSAVITDKDRDPIDVPSDAENANPARISSQPSHIQELSSTGVELEEEHFSDTGTDKVTTGTHKIPCDGSGDVIGQTVCESEEKVTRSHTRRGYGMDLSRFLEEEEGEDGTPDYSSGTDQLPAKADQMSCDGSGDVFGQALCKSEAGVTGGRTGLGYGTDLFRILEDEDETQDYSEATGEMRFSCGGSGDVGDDFEKKDQCDMSKRSSAGLTLDPICEEDEEPMIGSTPLGGTTAPSFGITFGFSTDDVSEMLPCDPKKTESNPISIPDDKSEATGEMSFYCGGSGDVGDDFEKKDHCDMSKQSYAGLTLDPIFEEDEEPIIRSTPLGSTAAPSFGFTFGFSTDDEPEMPSSDPEKTESQPLSIPDGSSGDNFPYKSRREELSFFWQSEDDDELSAQFDDHINSVAEYNRELSSICGKQDDEEWDDFNDEMVDSASLNNESPSRAPRRSRSSKQSDLKNTLDSFIRCDVDLSDIDNGKSGTEYDKILEEEENRNNDDLVSLSEPSSTWYDMPLPPWGYPEQRFIELKQIVNKSNLSDLYPEGSCLTRKSKPAISRRLLTKYGLSSSGVTCSTPSKKRSAKKSVTIGIHLAETKKADGASKKANNTEEFNTIKHLELLFKEHEASEILKSGFDDAMVCVPPLLLVSSVGYNHGIRKLIAAGADVNLQNPKDGNTPLILATKGKHVESMSILLNHNANVSIPNQEGNNALMIAVTTGAPAPVNLLWQYKIKLNLDYRNKRGCSALLLAAEKCWESCINMLLSCGANKNLVCDNGDSALAICTKANDKKSVSRLLAANVRITTENKAFETPLCIAITQEKTEIIEMITKKMAPTERQFYIVKKLELLKRKSYSGYASDVDYFLSVLFPVLHKLLWHDLFRSTIQNRNFAVAMISMFCRHMTHDELIQRSTQLLLMSLHDKQKLEHQAVNDFIIKQCPEILLKSLQFYNSTNKHKTPATVLSLLLPIMFSCTQSKGKEWLRENWSSIISYVQMYEKTYLHLHYEDNRSMVDSVWKTFKKQFETIQQEKADIACAELLQTEAQEKAKIEKRERKKARKQKKRVVEGVDDQVVAEVIPLPCNEWKEESAAKRTTNNTSKQLVDLSIEDETKQMPTTSDKKATHVDCTASLVVTAVDDMADVADDEDEAEDEIKSAKQKKKRRKRRKGKANESELDERDSMLNKDEIRVAFPYDLSNCAHRDIFDQSDEKDQKFEPVVSKRSVKQRKRLTTEKQRLQSGLNADSFDENHSNKSNQSSKSVSPLPARDITLPVNLDQASLNTAIGVDHTKLQSTPENLEVLPDTLVDNQEKDSITTQRSAVSSTGMDSNDIITSRDGSPEKPIQLLTAKTSRILLRDAPNSILGSEISSTKTSTAFLNANVTEAERNDLASLHTEDPHNTPDCPLRNGIQEANRFSTASQPQPSTATNTPFPPAVVPTSWADLLKDKDAEFPKLGAKVACNPTAFTWAYTSKNSSLIQPLCLHNSSAPDSTESSHSSRKEKDGFTLSEFILPEVARKINSGQGDALGAGSISTSDPQSTDSDIGLLSQNDLIVESVLNDPADDCQEQRTKESNKGISTTNSLVEDTSRNVTNQVGKNNDYKENVPSQPTVQTNTPTTVSPRDRDYLVHYMDEEFPIGKVPLLDPRYTNFLTDIRIPDIKPSPLDDIGFLSSDSDDEVDAQQPSVNTAQQIPGLKSSRIAPKTIMQNPASNHNQMQQNKFESSLSAAEPANQRNMDFMTALYYQNAALIMQQRSSNMAGGGINSGSTAAGMTNLWMPPYNTLLYRNQLNNQHQQTAAAYSQHTMFGSATGPPSNSGFRPGPHRSVAQPPNFYQQPPSPAVVAANKLYSHQQKANSIMSQSQQYPLVNAIQASNDNSNNPTANNMALIWQDSMPAKRHDMLTWQFQSMPKEKLIIKGNIVLCMENKFILGKSATYSADVLVLLGMVGKVPAAVKRIPMALFAPLKETIFKLLQPKFHNEFLVRYLDIAKDDHYGYVAQELCDYTLDEYLHLLVKKKGLNPAVDVSVLFRLVYQFFRGLQMLHCRCSMLHRNLKPSNILIDASGKLKLSDYGLTHVTSEGMTVFYSNKLGDNIWRPRECIGNSQQWITGAIPMAHYTWPSDIQVAGMVAHYILTAGQHAFGENPFDIEVNISGGWPKIKDITNEANHLLSMMVSKEPRDRPDIHTVLRHPYFWSEKRRYEMLVGVGCELVEMAKTYCYKNLVTEKLNNINCHIVSRDWCKAIETKLVDEMEVDRNSATTVCDLLMFIFHIHQNYNRLSIHVRSGLGQPHVYFLSRFPHLFIAVYKIVRSSEWINKPALKQYLL